jgi:hypothetical protein
MTVKDMDIISSLPLRKRKDVSCEARCSVFFHDRLNFNSFFIPQMSKKYERLNYMTEAHVISDGNYFDGNVKFQEKEGDKVLFVVWRNLIFCVIFMYKKIVRFFYTCVYRKNRKGGTFRPYPLISYPSSCINLLPFFVTVQNKENGPGPNAFPYGSGLYL